MTGTKKIKVCHVSTVHDRFDDRIFLKECVSLAKAGYEVFFVVQSPEAVTVEDVHIVPVRSFKNRVARILFAPCAAFFKSLSTKASVYHFHDPELIVLAPWYRLLGKKVIFDSHEDVPRQIYSKTWIKSTFIRRMVSGIYGFVEKCAVLFCNAVISVTPEIVARFPEKKRALVRNFPVLRLAENAQPANEEKKTKVAIYAGGLSHIRGIRETIRAVDTLQGKVELWLLGKWSSEDYLAECRSELGWKYVRYLGNKKPDEVYAYYHLADLGVTLLYPEENYLKSLPVKAFEYMACGLPIIMSDFPYWKQNFPEGAIFVNPFDPVEISNAIRRLVEDEAARKAAGEAGKKMAFENYSWEKESETLIQLYSKLTGGN